MLAALAKPAATITIATLLFFISGAEVVDGFLKEDLAQETLGVIATVLALLLGLLVRHGVVSARPSS